MQHRDLVARAVHLIVHFDAIEFDVHTSSLASVHDGCQFGCEAKAKRGTTDG